MKEKKEKKDVTAEEQIEKLAADVEHWKNEYYRAYADMQNLRKQIEADHKNAIKYRAEGFVADMLPILDGFHMALQNPPSSEEMKNFLIGFEFIYRNLVSVLENEGVKELAPKVGDEFDPQFMQAMETQETDGEPNKVLKVVTCGYKLHEHLIRPSMVVVSIKKEQKDENKQENSDSPKADA